jgi:hypothetical protein
VQRSAPADLIPDEPSDLHNPANAADEIMLAYDDFAADIAPLAAVRQAQGLRVQVVRLSDVYDEFSGGIATPQAIRDFLAYATANWARPAPSYLLLVGDANLDYLDRFLTGRPNYMPTYIFDAGDVGETANDTWYAQLAGDDPVPDLYVGRLPARNSPDVQAMVAKIIAYEAAPRDPWQNRALFVADAVSPHPEIAELWAAQMSSRYQVQRVYSRNYPPGNPTTDIVNAINAGAFAVTYIGHGNIDRWGTWSGGRLFDTSKVALLTNSTRLTLALTADCLNGFFVHPYTDETIAETLVRKAGGGAVGVWSPSALGTPGQQRVLFQALYDQLLAPQQPILGRVTTLAKAAGYSRGVGPELIETFTLFGDPATRLQRSISFESYLPLVASGMAP